MYKILHIPTGTYVMDYYNKPITIRNIPEDKFDKADILRQVILTTLRYTTFNHEIKESSAGLDNLFSEFIFVEIGD
jgi:hypothetical protein